MPAYNSHSIYRLHKKNQAGLSLYALPARRQISGSLRGVLRCTRLIFLCSSLRGAFAFAREAFSFSLQFAFLGRERHLFFRSVVPLPPQLTLSSSTEGLPLCGKLPSLRRSNKPVLQFHPRRLERLYFKSVSGMLLYHGLV